MLVALIGILFAFASLYTVFGIGMRMTALARVAGAMIMAGAAVLAASL